MSKCPKCGSIRIIEGLNLCLSCESFINMINDESKQTVFDIITASPEVLAPILVVEVITVCYTARFVTGYRSIVIPGKLWEHEAEAIAATVAKLKEVCNG